MAKKSKQIKNSVPTTEVTNGLTDVVMGGFNPLNTGTPLSQVDPLFNNVKTYLISNMRQILSQFYVEHGLCQAIVDIPVDDALRGGFDIKTEQLDEDDIRLLKAHMAKHDDIDTIKQALKWTRLYGGGGIVYMTNQIHSNPLDLKNLEGLELRAVDMWELFSDQQNINDDTRKLDIKPNKDFCYSYYTIQLHNSRVLPIKGKIAPSFIRPRLRGWGFSVMESLIQSINQFLKTKNLTYEVLDEFKLDIFKINGFNQAILTKEGTDKILRRVQLANQQKNFQNALTMDAQDEHQAKQLSFSGLSDVQKEIRIQVASDMKMPLTKLFGLSASGFSSGEDEIEVYNGMIESDIRPKAKKVCRSVVEIRCQELFGFIPSDLEIEFLSLRVLSQVQLEEVKDKKCNRLVALFDKGAIDLKELRDCINRGDLVDIKLEGDLDEESSIDETSSEMAQDA